MNYKRYLVFAFSEYYPSGGLGDVTFNSENLNDCIENIRDHNIHEYCYVYDSFSGKTVYDIEKANEIIL